MPRARRGAQTGNSSVSHNDLVKLAKRGLNHSEAAAELGVSVGSISSMKWSKALVDAGQWGEIPATAAAVKKARDVESNRWELIAARTGEGVARVKELYGGEEAAAASYVGRGRNFSNGDTTTKKTTTKKTTTGKTTTAKTTGRGSKTTSAAAPRRARTRAERRAARSNNPS